MPKIRPDSAIFISLMALLLLLLLLPIQPPPKAYAQTPDVEYWAVIVGVADYKNFGPPPSYVPPLPWVTYDLLYAADDAQDLYNKLCPHWGADHIKLLIDSQATKAGIQSAITGWLDSKEGDDDVVLFFFSGHGGRYQGHEYLSPYDALTYSYANDIRDTQLDSWLDELESTKVVVILDACYSGGFIDELGQTGRVILTASRSDESSWAFTALGHGVFPYYILDGFDNLEAVDTDNDHEISAEELFRYAEPKVVAYGDKDQHPQLYDGYAGELNLFSYTPPTIISINPNQGGQGQTFDVTITGTNFTGATAVSFGARVTVNSFTVDSSTQITANITIAAAATTGVRDVSVTTPGGTGTLTGGFTVAASSSSLLLWIIGIVGGAGIAISIVVILRRRRRVHIYPIEFLSKVNINIADAALLETLSGIGPVKAQNIIDYRNRYGPFLRKEDLMYVDGIGEETYRDLEDEITI